MWRCSVIKKLQIVRGDFEDYKKLARFHYRDNRPGVYTAIFVIKPIQQALTRRILATENNNVFCHREHRGHREYKVKNQGSFGGAASASLAKRAGGGHSLYDAEYGGGTAQRRNG